MYILPYCYMYPVPKPDFYNFALERTLLNMAVDAYIYGYPLVLGDITRRMGFVSLAQINRFYNQKVLSTPDFTQVVRPNVDTLYSSAWLDLSKGPLLLQVPDTQNRYYVFSMLDAWSNVFASVGARTTGTAKQNFVLTGPGWQGTVPMSANRIYSPTNTVWIIGRTQTDGPEDYTKVHALQKKYKISPLISTYIPSDFLQDPIIISQTPPKYQVSTMDANAFFTAFMAVMYKNPPYPAIQTQNMNEKLMSLGLIPSPDFDFHKLDPLIQHVLEYAAKNGPRIIGTASRRMFGDISLNGWSMPLTNVGTYGTNYLQRAVVATAFFGANLPEDSVYAYSSIDINGKQLDGRNNYIIHFKHGKLPSNNAFWSITLYNSEGFLVKNPIKRYAVSSHIGKLNYNPDGSLDIFIQNLSPGENLEANWLPAPTGVFNLLFRVYRPGTSVLNGQWYPPAVEQRN